jgi:two-component system NtrC family sensor kinase
VRPAAKRLVDMNELLETSLRLASFDKSFQKLKVVKNFASELPDVFADYDQLQQVFLNLLLNARDAMPFGGELKIQTSHSLLNEEVKIEITDSGTGIKEQDVKKIFDPFFTTKPAGKGSGLGLAVCYGIITAHGGNIEVSSGLGDGTSFLILLPIKKAANQ